MPLPYPDKIWPKLEKTGLVEVKKRLLMGAYAKYKIPVIKEWIRLKEKESHCDQESNQNVDTMIKPQQEETLFDKFIRKLKNHPIVSIVLMLGIATIALANFTESIYKLLKPLFTENLPVERILQIDTLRSIADDLKLILADVNPNSLLKADQGGVIIPLTVNVNNLRRLEKLNATPGFSNIARLHIDHTSVIINGVGMQGRFNDVNAYGQLVPVDVELLMPIR